MLSNFGCKDIQVSPRLLNGSGSSHSDYACRTVYMPQLSHQVPLTHDVVNLTFRGTGSRFIETFKYDLLKACLFGTRYWLLAEDLFSSVALLTGKRMRLLSSTMSQILPRHHQSLDRWRAQHCLKKKVWRKRDSAWPIRPELCIIRANSIPGRIE